MAERELTEAEIKFIGKLKLDPMAEARVVEEWRRSKDFGTDKDKSGSKSSRIKIVLPNWVMLSILLACYLFLPEFINTAGTIVSGILWVVIVVTLMAVSGLCLPIIFEKDRNSLFGPVPIALWHTFSNGAGKIDFLSLIGKAALIIALISLGFYIPALAYLTTLLLVAGMRRGLRIKVQRAIDSCA